MPTGLSFCLQMLKVYFNMKACQLYCKGGFAFCQHRLHNASPLSPCYFEWCLSSAELPHIVCPGPSNMRRLIEVKGEKWVESQMAFYLIYKTNKHRVGPLPFMFHTVSPVPCTRPVTCQAFKIHYLNGLLNYPWL